MTAGATRRCVLLLLSPLLLLAPARAELLSRNYEFKTAVTLTVGDLLADGVRVDAVRFHPGARPGQSRSAGPLRAEVSLSNTSRHTRRIGVALALFDDQARLVGVASGGSRFAPLRPGRQRTYRLVFQDVNAHAHRARTFQISVETRP